MKTLSNPEKAFSYHLYGSGEDGLVTFVLSVPVASLQAFIDYADQRKKYYSVPLRVSTPEYQKECQDRVDFFKSSLLTIYDRLLKKLSQSEAISETNKIMKEKGFCNCSYNITKNILSAAGRLKKK